MKNAATRACAWISLALLTYAPLTAAQTLEIYAGGGHFVDIPGNTIGLQPGGMAAAADGFVYLNDLNGRLMRIDTASGLVSALPATPGGIAYNIGYSYTVAVDFTGHPYVYSQGRLNRIEANGTLTDVGPLSYTGASAFGPDGSLYVAPGDNRVYAQRPSGIAEAVAGQESAGYSGDGGPAALAELNSPQGVAVSPAGDIYIADTQNHRIRRIDANTGVISTFAGTGNAGATLFGAYRDQTDIYAPYGLAFDAAGNLFVTTYSGGLVLRIDAVSGLVAKIGGGGSGGDGGPAIDASMRPRLIAVDSNGNVFFSDWKESYQKIRRIDAASGALSLAVGYDSFYFCGENVPARQVCLAQPLGLDVDADGYLVFADPVYRSIRRIAPGSGILSTWKTTTESPIGIEHDAAGNVYVASFGGYQVNRYDAVTGAKTVVAGNGSYGASGDGGPATQASLMSPVDVALDAGGNLYIADGSGRIRKVAAATGLMSSLANLSTSVVEIDPGGNLIAGGNCSIYRVDPQSGAYTRIAGTGSCGYQDPAGGTLAASTQLPNAMTFAVAPDGNIYLGWQSAQLFEVNTTTGMLTRVPAPPAGLATPEGIRIRSVTRMEFDPAGNLYISQQTSPNQYIFKVSGLVDTTPPAIEPVITGTAGTNGWYRSNVQVGWVVSDAGSAIVSRTGCDDSAVGVDTAGVTFTCTATSAGGTASRSVTVKLDTTPPTLQWGAFSPQPNANGWNKTDVTVPFTSADATSGVLSISAPSPLVMSTEGEGVVGQVTVTDAAGNTQVFSTDPRNIDKTAPVVSLNSPDNGADFGLYQDVVSDFGCSDISLLSCTGTTAEGAFVNTRTAGTRSYKVTAKDRAGFTTSVTHTYHVAGAFDFDGFLGAAPSPAPNIVRKGSLVPLRWRLPDGHGGFVTNTASFSSIATTTVSCPSGAVAYGETAVGGSGIKFDPATNVFSYNWKSSSSFTGCKQIFITLKDGTQHDLVFRFQ